MIEPVSPLEIAVERLGVVMTPDGDPNEAEGTLNPAAARTRSGELILYPRVVAKGNISRVGRARVTQNRDGFEVDRNGYALEPRADYEVRKTPGYGCEDPRVTFVSVLDSYVMCYTAYGPLGPRVAIALSHDALTWERLGLLRFDEPGMADGEDKDAAFFPEPVISPKGVRSLAFYHRPMLHLSAVDGRAAVPMIQRLPYEDRESIRIGYIPLEPALRNRDAICNVTESEIVLSPNEDWGSIKVGAGTPPVRIDEGWLSVFHGVDLIDNSGAKPKFRYSAGVVIHDHRQPHRILYRSPHPVLSPQTEYERRGVVDNVVFPSGLDERADLGDRTFDIYYGMADYSIGAARMTLR